MGCCRMSGRCLGRCWHVGIPRRIAKGYGCGAERLAIRVNGETETVVLDAQRLQLRPYNHKLNGTIAHLKQTKKRGYLEKLAECSFIVPVRIRNSASVQMSYGIVRHKVDSIGQMYLAFSTLDEFTLWRADKEEWDPLAMSFDELYRIAKKDGVMLNPEGNRLILTPEMMSVIRHAVKKEETS